FAGSIDAKISRSSRPAAGVNTLMCEAGVSSSIDNTLPSCLARNDACRSSFIRGEGGGEVIDERADRQLLRMICPAYPVMEKHGNTEGPLERERQLHDAQGIDLALDERGLRLDPLRRHVSDGSDRVPDLVFERAPID